MQNASKKATKNQRDIMFIIVLFLIVGGVFLYFQVIRTQSVASYAHIYYGTSSEPMVTIDFVKQDVEILREQNVPGRYDQDYPRIDETERTITLLGDYEINGIRQIIVIKYDFGSKTVEIIEEQSPNNICSKEGVSSGKPLICLPNRVRIEFESDADNPDFSV